MMRKMCIGGSMNVQPFSGSEKESWKEWIKNFERILRNRKLHKNDRKSALVFSEHIKEEALIYYNSLRRKEQNSWELTKNKFDDRFGIKQTKLSGKRDLVQLKLKPGETSASFVQKFITAMEKTYPGTTISLDEENGIWIELFICAVNNNSAYEFIMSRKHKNLRQVSKSLQYFLEMEAGKSTSVLRTCMGKGEGVESQVQGKPEKRKAQAEEQDSEMQKMKSQIAALQSKLDRGQGSQDGKPGNKSKGKDGKGSNTFKSREDKVGSKAWIIKNEIMPIPNQHVRNVCWFCAEEGHTCLNCEAYWGNNDSYFRRKKEGRDVKVNLTQGN
jgi:hypothetical protein